MHLQKQSLYPFQRFIRIKDYSDGLWQNLKPVFIYWHFVVVWKWSISQIYINSINNLYTKFNIYLECPCSLIYQISPGQTWFCVFIYSSVFCLCCLFAYKTSSGLSLRIIIVISWVFFSVGNESGVAPSTYRIRLLTSYSRLF